MIRILLVDDQAPRCDKESQPARHAMISKCWHN